jgi:predicted N-acyltransferase
MVTRIINCVKDVNVEVWNAVLRGPFYSHEWFSYVEEQCQDEYLPFYILAYKDNEICSILPTFVPKTINNAYDIRYWGRLRKINHIFPLLHKRSLLCFSPDTLCSAGFFSSNRLEKTVLHEILLILDDIAKEKSLSDIVFMYVLEENVEEMESLTSYGYQKVYLNSPGILKSTFQTFDEYIRSLSPNGRSTVRREMKKFKKSASILEVICTPRNEIEILHRLTNNIQEKHNVGENPYSEKKLAAVFEYMKKYLTCYVVRYDEKIIGTVSLVEKDGILATFALGLDYENILESGTYFYLFYYNTIMEMTKRKVDSVNFDALAYGAKERRGCNLVPQYMLIKRRKGKLAFGIWKHILNYQYMKKFRSYYLSSQ